MNTHPAQLDNWPPVETSMAPVVRQMLESERLGADLEASQAMQWLAYRPEHARRASVLVLAGEAIGRLSARAARLTFNRWQELRDYGLQLRDAHRELLKIARHVT